MFGLMNIILASPYKTSTLQVTYSFGKILKVIFMIHTSSTWFYAKLIFTSTPFSDETIITYDIDLPPSGKKIGFNLLDYEDFTMPYITDTIPNSPAGYQLPSQANRNVWIVSIKG